MHFLDMMNLESHGPDTFVGNGPAYPWGGLYGGHIVAQTLRAAGLTVGEEFRPHSLHAYFVRRGDSSEPIRFEVERVRNGRSFVTRSVEARQSTGAILTMTASFQVDEDAPEIQKSEMPGASPPDEIASQGWSEFFDRRMVTMDTNGTARGWVKMAGDLGDDPLIQACALAYASDDLPTDAIVALHPDVKGWEDNDNGQRFMSASLDHAIWFHRRARADRWHLQDFRAHSIAGSRGVSIGQFFQDGTHIATVAQEVLLRVAHP